MLLRKEGRGCKITSARKEDREMKRYFILNRFKRKVKPSTIDIDLIENKALERVMPLARQRARDYLCRDCLDRRCLTDSVCRAFIQIARSYAWEIVAEKAELN